MGGLLEASARPTAGTPAPPAAGQPRHGVGAGLARRAGVRRLAQRADARPAGVRDTRSGVAVQRARQAPSAAGQATPRRCFLAGHDATGSVTACSPLCSSANPPGGVTKSRVRISINDAERGHESSDRANEQDDVQAIGEAGVDGLTNAVPGCGGQTGLAAAERPASQPGRYRVGVRRQGGGRQPAGDRGCRTGR